MTPEDPDLEPILSRVPGYKTKIYTVREDFRSKLLRELHLDPDMPFLQGYERSGEIFYIYLGSPVPGAVDFLSLTLIANANFDNCRDIDEDTACGRKRGTSVARRKHNKIEDDSQRVWWMRTSRSCNC